jgi:cytochrome c5
MRATAFAVAMLAAVAACDGSRTPDRAALAAQAARSMPADSHLADLYAHACRTCHANAASAAPLTTDRGAWRDRLKKGLPALVASCIQGLNGMPAGGQCVRCTEADYEALIRFMADLDNP